MGNPLNLLVETTKKGEIVSVNEKIRVMREVNQWSQEEMANKMNMSTNGYAKIERGETKLSLHKLEQIAAIFNIDVLELMNTNSNGLILLMNENGDHSANYYSDNANLAKEIEKLELIINHKNEIIQQKNDEINALKEIITLLKNK